MRVITGTARGMTLRTLEGDNVRPTTDKGKEAVFSAIQFEIEGRRVLDLFAGTGAISFELLSRGCESVTAVEKANTQYAFMKKVEAQLKTALDGIDVEIIANTMGRIKIQKKENTLFRKKKSIVFS